MEFKSSINVKYDYKDKKIVKDYYATTAHADLMKNILHGINDLSKINSHIAFGPYGSGKSYVISILLGLLTRSYDKKTIDILSKKFDEVDSDIHNLLINFYNSKKTYLPLIINGFEGDINDVIKKKISKLINDQNITVSIPGEYESIISIVNQWEKNFPQTYEMYKNELIENKITLKEFNYLLQEYDKKAFELFEKIFHKLTSGSILNLHKNIPIEILIEKVCEQLQSKDIGIILVYDEFGRYLNSLNDYEVNSFMQHIQNLAELANNGVSNFSNVFITHKQINYYFSNLSQANRSEFSKVEKRFKSLEIKSDYFTFLNIAKKFISEYSINNQQDYSISKIAYRFNPFSGLISDLEFENSILKRMYPLHPISAFLLPRVSSVFGQNERTMFSFLSDRSQFGFFNYLIEERGFYFPDFLVDYFFTNIDESLLDNKIEFHTFRANIKKIPGQVARSKKETAERIYKFLILWKVTNSMAVILASSEFISFSLGLDLVEINNALKELELKKFVRFNMIENQWEIFQGSPLKIDDEIDNLFAKQGFDDEQFQKHLNRYNPLKYIYANEHNRNNEITRFAIMNLFVSNYQIYNVNKSDLTINIYFNNEKNRVFESSIVGNCSLKTDLIKELVRRKYFLNLLLNNSYYTNNYINLESELKYEILQVESKLKIIYSNILKNSYFNEDGEVVTFSTEKELQLFISKIFDKKYTKYIHIVNDQINMFKLTKIQSNAIKQVTKKLIESEKLLDLENQFTGTQPSDLVYFTLIKNLHRINNNSNNLNHLSRDLKSYILRNPKGNLFDLISIAQKPPYGIRPEPSILITFNLLKSEWKNMLLFMNESFIPTIKIDDLYENLLNVNSSLQYVFSSFDHQNSIYLNDLEDLFKTDDDYLKDKTLSIRVCGHMYNWYLSLPVITQQYESMGISDISFLKIISASRINPEIAVNKLIEFSSDIDIIKHYKLSVENHFNKYLINFEKTTLKELGIDNKDTFLEESSLLIKKSNPIYKALQSGSLVNYYKEQIENIDIEKWTKSSFTLLKNFIIQQNNLLSGNSTFNSIIINGKEKLVQDVNLSNKADITRQNIDNIINATKKYMTSSELEKIIIHLVEKYVR